jgi:hypothetical protein
MKHRKIGLVVVVVATAALMAMVGASSAMAENTSLCVTNPGTPFECTPAANQWASGTVLKGATGTTPEDARLATNIKGANVECMSSVEGHTTAATGNPLAGVITALNWTECHIEGEPTNTCTVASVHLPYNSAISWTAMNKGTLTATTGTGGKPGATVVCGAVINCEFLKENAVLEAEGGVAGVAFAKANAIALTIGAGTKCPTTATWTAKYILTSPTPVFITK